MRKLYGLLLGLFFLCLQASAQTREVTGKITDSKDGSALSGVTVTAKGTSISTISGSDGTFRLTVPESNRTLVFSYVGYQSTEVEASSLMNVSMQGGNASLTEVVVVGYGTKVRRDVISSIA